MTGENSSKKEDEPLHRFGASGRGAGPSPGLLDLMSDRRRRYVLSYLVNSSDVSAPFDEVIAHVAARERADRGEVDAVDDHRQRVAVSLHHVHLPKLAESGVLEYDQRSRTVRYHGDVDLERWLAAFGESTPQ